jgi:heptosyltransferase-1
MRVLLIKTSSMGDLIHTLPALTDAGNAIPGIRFDWVVEEPFAEIPEWHPLVDRVIPVALRRWRKGLLSAQTQAEWKVLRATLNERSYDLVLDAQGLVKSGFLAMFAKGPRAGLDFRSARESLASFAYQRKHTVNFYQHAVVRMRSLFSQALGYPLPVTPPVFGVDKQQFHTATTEDYIVFLHGTTWPSKQWPESYWQELGQMAADRGWRIKISGGNDEELARAARIAAGNASFDLLPRQTIKQMAGILAGARASVAVDTGFGHLSGALNVPTVSIYGSTNADFTGALGESSVLLSADFPCSPCLSRLCTYREPAPVTPACYGTVPPLKVWSVLTGF